MSSLEPVASAVIGFRAWRLDGSGSLMPVFYSTFKTHLVATWKNPEFAEAICERGGASPCENSDCQCGLYCWKRPKNYGQNGKHFYWGGDISGAVVAWGEIEDHKIGFRAQYAKPIGFFESPKHNQPDTAMKFKMCMKKHDLPYLPYKELYEYAQWFGDLLEFEDSDREIGHEDSSGAGFWADI
jgi:hypothetical protein